MDAAIGSMIENLVDEKALGYMMFLTYLTLASTAYETTLKSEDMETYNMFDMAERIDRFLEESHDLIEKMHPEE